MAKNGHGQKPAQKGKTGYIAIIMITALILNLVGKLIASSMEAPLSLDTIGTIFSAVLLGYLPGMVVGFITNIIEGMMSSTHDDLYYCVLNVLTALLAHLFAKKDAFKKPAKLPLCIIILTLATGISGAVLTWSLNNFSVGGVSQEFVQSIQNTSGFTGFLSQMIGDTITEFIDKTISVTVVYLLLRLLPKRVIELSGSLGLHNNISSEEMKKDIMSAECRRVSLKTKVMAILFPAAIMIAGAAAVISFMLFKNYTIDEHTALAERLAQLEAKAIDPEKVDEFIELGENAEGYLETEKELQNIYLSSTEVQFVYVYKIMEDGCHVVFDIDTEDLTASSPGDIIEFDESFLPYLPDLLAGKPIDPIISDDQFGWLLTVYTPVYDNAGNCRCYAAVDISMDLLSNYGISFMAKLIALLLGILSMILGFGVWIVEYNIILPVNTLAYCAGSFAYNSESARAESVERLRQISIDTGDEIENLYNALLKTTADSMDYVADIQNKTATISKMQNGLIMVLADMVESRDKCTGDHVRKTAAYVDLIMREMKQLGYYEDQMTDEFITNVKNAAPLHDIGKIKISDTILNKPGKLTDEEFEIMKQHTTLGGEIIDRAIDMVADSGYLAEAKNVSEYHHEKWNGKGYPHGISGEAIPLSARIMAVADVFDALVSQRSYKKPFDFEKAMSIIEEDAGSHFDPLVASAFLGAADEVRKIAEEHAKNM